MLDLITLPFFQRALLIGLITGALMAVLGVIIVLRQMSFFADAIGHSALPGIALGILLKIDPFLAAFAFTIIIALGIAYTRHRTKLDLDTLLGTTFPAAVALGVIIMQQNPSLRTDLLSALFGDILTVSSQDIILSIVLAIIVGGTMLFAGKKFLTITLSPALAHTQGIRVPLYETILLVILAATIAVAIKFIGIILVTAMLVIPAASAQNIARSVTSMFSLSIVISLFMTIVGMLVSATLNTPSGPTIILTGALCFILSMLVRRS